MRQLLSHVAANGIICEKFYQSTDFVIYFLSMFNNSHAKHTTVMHIYTYHTYVQLCVNKQWNTV